MKKTLSLLLVTALLLTACQRKPKDTFTAYAIKTCTDYFTYLSQPGPKGEGGIVHELNCEGVMDYQADAKLPYGFLITVNGSEQRIGLHVLDAESDNLLQTLNGQPLTVTGELHIQSPDPNGVGLFAKEEDIRVVPAF